MHCLVQREVVGSLVIGKAIQRVIEPLMLTNVHRRFETCGHRCLAKCHSKSMHQAFKCPNRCERVFEECGHKCPKDCSEPCGTCSVIVDGISLPCGHDIDQVPCHTSQNISSIKCTFEVQKRVPDCDHILTVSCYQDVTSRTFKCPVNCSILLECGHPCQGTCGTCNIPASKGKPREEKHSECPKICGRRYATCQHMCERACHGSKDCGLCPQTCQVSCIHLSRRQCGLFIFATDDATD